MGTDSNINMSERPGEESITLKGPSELSLRTGNFSALKSTASFFIFLKIFKEMCFQGACFPGE